MHVKQIANLFELMKFFVRAKKPLSAQEIVEEFAWPRSSVFNTISTLVDLGYLYQPTARGGYYPTGKWMDLARELSEAQPLPESLHKLLVKLAKETGETLYLATAEGTCIVFLDVVESSADLRFIANVGQRIPIHIAAAGRAILSQYSDTERAATLKRIKYQRHENDAFMTPESVEKDIEQSRQQELYINMGIYAPGVSGIAVPLTFQNRHCALALGGPISRIEKKIDTLGKLLHDSVDQFLQQHERK